MITLEKNIIKLVSKDADKDDLGGRKLELLDKEGGLDNIGEVVDRLKRIDHSKYEYMNMVIEDISVGGLIYLVESKTSDDIHLSNYKENKSKYQERIVDLFLNDYIEYMNLFFKQAVKTGEEYCKAGNEYHAINKELEKLGLKFGSVGEENYKYYISDISIDQEFIQDYFYNENFYKVQLISGKTMETIDEIDLGQLPSSMTSERFVEEMNFAFDINGFYLVDNYGAEQFDEIKKVKENKILHSQYVLE